jgi:branched-chain amino acid transport system permease protein
VLAYALSGFPAGVAGVLYAYISQFLVPELFTVTVAIALIAAAVVGGVESVYGAIVGAALLQLGPMSSLAFQQYATAAYGAFLIVAGIVFRRGLGGLGVAAGRRVSHWLAPEGHVDPSIAAGYSEFHSGSGRPDAATELVAKRAAAPAREGRQLEVDGVSKRFAGVHALKDVTLTAPAGEVTGLIGSNGSGKTTLLNVICGYVKADAGAVQYGDARLIGLGPHQVASEAVGRTFQTPSIPRGVSVLDVIASGRFSSHKVGVASSILRLPPYWRAHREDRRAAAAALELVGLLDVAEEEAGKQPLGTRRLIEVARMLCSDATLLLLDEPASGLADEEVRRLGEVVRSAADAGATVLLIEHNFGFVTSVSDTVHVLHFGERIASGDAATIGHDPKVIESYLGTSQSEAPDVATSPGTRGE